MILRQNVGRRPQLTFTSDFHELVSGDLEPGPCLLRYDPLRLIPREELHDENHHIKAYVRFHPGGALWEGAMVVPKHAPIEQLEDPTGQGYMSELVFNIPAGCRELEIWFACHHDDGSVHWDSEMGRNFWIRFPLEDIQAIERAEIVPASDGHDAFEIEVRTAAAVDRVDVRWRLTHPPGHPRKSAALACVRTEAGAKTWRTPPGGIAVPEGATLVFDLVYAIHDREFTDDNQGNWYLVAPSRSHV